MRALGLIYLLLCISASAAEPVLEISEKSRYGTEETKILREGTQWICETELRGKYSLKEKPAALTMLSALKANMPLGAIDCGNQVTIKEAGKKTLVICSQDPAWKRALDRLDRECGRN